MCGLCGWPLTDHQAALVSHFANEDIVQANERVVLLSPFTPGDTSNRWSSPQLDADVQGMWWVCRVGKGAVCGACKV